MDISTIKGMVKALLIKKPELRDNDSALIATVWWYQSQDISDKTEFLRRFANKKYTNPESIRRCRQKLQELNPDLRGDNWNKEHNTKEKQSSVKQQLNNF